LGTKNNLLYEIKDHGGNINAAYYCTTVQHLKEAFQMKCPGLLSEELIHIYNSAYPQTTCVTAHYLESAVLCLVHPPHSPDLAPYNYHFIRPVMNHSEGKALLM
jgi:histone-lysine N-methyltransferase SETMAR